jgi:hypothetical protein
VDTNFFLYTLNNFYLHSCIATGQTTNGYLKVSFRLHVKLATGLNATSERVRFVRNPSKNTGHTRTEILSRTCVYKIRISVNAHATEVGGGMDLLILNPGVRRK